MMTIQECLMKKTKDEMRMAIMRMGLKLPMTNRKKAELAEYMERGMMEEPSCVLLLLTMQQIDAVNAQLEMGETVAERDVYGNEELWDGLLALEDVGLAYKAQKKWHMQPCLRELLKMTEELMEEQQVHDLIAALAEGWLIHVGMMPLEQLLDRITAQLKPEEESVKIVRDVIFTVLIARRTPDCLFPDEHGEAWVVHEDVDDPDVLLCRLEEEHIARLTYPDFSLEQLVFTALYSHLPGTMELYEPLMAWMEAHDAEEEEMDDALETMVYLAQNDDVSEAIESVMELVEPNDLKDANRCAEACQRVLNAIPRWANKGRAPESFFRPQRVAVPGRNDPCSCGSGKKYKQCCGKRLN